MKNIELKDINTKTISDLPPVCSACLYWEVPDKFNSNKRRPRFPVKEAAEIKRDWFRRVSETSGNVGKLLYADGKTVGYAQYAPPQLLENALNYSRELFPPSPEGILLSCLYIMPDYQRKGLGTKLLRSVIEELREKGHQVLETYSRDDSVNNCSGPTAFYLRNDFHVIKTKKWGNDGTFSLMKFEVR